MFSFLQSGLVLFAQGEGDGAGGLGLLPAMFGIMLLFYFFFMRPQSKARREKQDALKTLKKNDKVVTIGGIHGVVVGMQADGQEVVIRVDENNGTKIRMSRAAINEIIREGGSKGGTADSTEKTGATN